MNDPSMECVCVNCGTPLRANQKLKKRKFKEPRAFCKLIGTPACVCGGVEYVARVKITGKT